MCEWVYVCVVACVTTCVCMSMVSCVDVVYQSFFCKMVDW